MNTQPDNIRRAADFPYSGIRLRLSRDWGQGPRALVIGCNPSNADASRDDPTVRWWNAWFASNGFSGYDAMNLYPFVSSSPAECRGIVDGGIHGDWETHDLLKFVNLPALQGAAKGASQVFVCWGAIAWDQDWIEYVVEAVQVANGKPELWCWGETASGAPKHPLARGKHRIPADQPAVVWRGGSA